MLQTLSIIEMSVVILMRYEIGFQQLSIRTNGRPAIFLVLQVFSWVDARLSRTRTRKRRNRFKSISLLRKLEPRYLARLSTKSEYFSSSTSTVSLSMLDGPFFSGLTLDHPPDTRQKSKQSKEQTPCPIPQHRPKSPSMHQVG